MYSFRKSKKGFTLIELMVVVVIIGILALLGLRLYLTQIAKSNNALAKANAGTVQTTIQGDLADSPPSVVWADWTGGTLVTRTGIHNPLSKSPQTNHEITSGAAEAGDVWVSYSSAIGRFTINAKNADNSANVYTTTAGLTAKY